ncbi:hypothetical protein [Paenibacillus aceti]|uniref:Uncharacterized protein n=1 Tax=Paenibacillus aceti TaxID=1820010 RepID=A0ABQ1VPD0_9BACL|nr:hypothetical protein [Paenibacillus aceti]GGF86681.1 hypothetical protein GCM10010913_05240 [Paenibacillus aceti]
MNNNIKFLHELSLLGDSGVDPYEEFKQSLLAQGVNELDATHETALFMNMVCDMMD